MSAPLPARSGNNFNLLRLIFALLVLLSHAPELRDGNRSRELLTSIFNTLSFGEFAVDGFFLLSGYLILKSWISQPALWPFLKKRILRIYPGFIAASLICAFVIGPIVAEPAKYFSELWLPGFVRGMAMLGKPVVPPIFTGTPHPGVNGSMWTISLEFACYLSVLLLGVLGALKTASAWLRVTMLLVILFVVERMGYLSDPTGGMIKLGTFFFAGGCFYLYRERIQLNGKRACLAAGLLIVAMCSWRASELALATVGAYLLFYLAFKTSPFFARFNNLPDVSYGVYLYGWPVQKLFLWYFPLMSPWLLFPLSCVSCLLLGATSWYAIEGPCLKFKPQARSAKPLPSTS